jgi:tungstate transport system substrate-binding protein
MQRMWARRAGLVALVVALLALGLPAAMGWGAAARVAAAPAAQTPAQWAVAGGGLASWQDDLAVADAQMPANREVILATTTSTYDTGLLDALHPLFERATGYQVKTISVGTGQALALGARAEADVVLVHAPDAERTWMAEGNGTQRLLVMYNDFVLVGPPGDPAGVREATSAADALRRIAGAGATWVSRGDNSGTHILERQLWTEAGLDPAGRSWYLEVGQGMGQTLSIADDRRAYTLSDRGTWLARRATLDLPILVEGDPSLLNIYHIMPVNPAKSARINAAGGEAYAAWLVSAEAQTAIGEFGRDRFGQALFAPAAGRTEADILGR